MFYNSRRNFILQYYENSALSIFLLYSEACLKYDGERLKKLKTFFMENGVAETDEDECFNTYLYD